MTNRRNPSNGRPGRQPEGARRASSRPSGRPSSRDRARAPQRDQARPASRTRADRSASPAASARRGDARTRERLAGERRPSSRRAEQRGRAAAPSYASPGLWTKDGNRGKGAPAKAGRRASGGIGSAILSGIGGVLLLIARGIMTLVNALVQLLRRSRVALAVFALVVVVGAGSLVDMGLNWGKAYAGVHVGSIDVSGKSQPEIAALLEETYQPRLDETTVTVYASEEAREAAADGTDRAQSEALAEQVSVEEARANRQLWTTDASTLSATVPYDQLAEEALAVGRADGGLLARLSALMRGATIEPRIDCEESLLEGFVSDIDEAIGSPRVDYSIQIADGVASVTEGHDGMMVNRDTFAAELAHAFLESEDPYFVAETEYAPLRIDQPAAQAVCDQVNSVIAAGAVVTYGDATWSVSSTQLGSCISTEVREADGGWELVPYLDESLAKPLILSQAQEHHDGARATVSFSDDGDGTFTVHTNGAGEVPLTSEAVQALDAVMFGGQDSIDISPQETHDQQAGATHGERAADGAAQVWLVSAAAPAELSFEDALDAGVVSSISSFTTEYSSGAGTENRNHNIHLASDLLNGSIVAPDGTWSFNETAGNCNEEAGFLGAGSIVDGEYTDEVGGGICQVATTVFNAVYEAGLPVVARTNHSLYIASYPAGRDAAVSWPYLDLKWGNDSGSDILLLMSYTDTSVTATLYSVPSGYTVTTEEGQWEDGEKFESETEEDPSLAPGTSYVKTAGSDGRSIYVIRTVTDQDGNLVRQDRFDSVYDPITEVVAVAPGEGDSDKDDSDTASNG